MWSVPLIKNSRNLVTLQKYSAVVISCADFIIGSVQGQAGWSFEQSDLVKGVPAHGRGVD